MQQENRTNVSGADFAKITPMVSETLCLLAHNFKNAVDFIEVLMQEPSVPDFAKKGFLRDLKIKAAYCKREIDLRVTGEESKRRYEQLVKAADSQTFTNLLHLVSVMTPDQMEIVEQVLGAIKSGEKIQIEQV